MNRTIMVISYCLVVFSLFACSDDKIVGDPAKDWDSNSTERYIPVDEKGFSTFYSHSFGLVGDPMPFFDQKAGNFKVLYLQEYFKQNDQYCFHPIWAVQTSDGCNYSGMGEMLPVGSNKNQQDAALGTGCCYYDEANDQYYIYYTGESAFTNYRQAVMRATSKDFKTWKKDDLWQLNGPAYGYSAEDFRDPQIFKTDDGVFHMLISTYPKFGGDPQFAEFKSSNLKDWEHVGNFPMIWDRFLECPDVFKMGDWWYIVYSDSFKAPWCRKVKYKKAKSFEELKTLFGGDAGERVLDSRGFYAGKTASNGTDRFIWGWCPIRTDNDGFISNKIDEMNVNVGGSFGNEPAWSGALVCHKIIQHEDGNISLGPVPAIASKYGRERGVTVMASNNAILNGTGGQLTGDDSYVLYNRLGFHNHISFTVKTAGNTDKFGVSLVRYTGAEKYYSLIFNPEGDNDRKVNFEQEGPDGAGFIEGIDGYNFPRPADNVYHIDIYTDNSVMVMYINGDWAYTNRVYGIQNNCWSINNYGGSVTISDVKVSQQ